MLKISTKIEQSKASFKITGIRYGSKKSFEIENLNQFLLSVNGMREI